MYIFEMTSDFRDWITRLRDKPTRALILARIRSAELGNLGDCMPVGEACRRCEFISAPDIASISSGPATLSICLLAGGDKSTQRRDIARALEIAAGIKKD